MGSIRDYSPEGLMLSEEEMIRIASSLEPLKNACGDTNGDDVLNQADLEWFLDLRRYGSVPHAGFGLGIERCVAWICGLHHVRETIPFARTLDRLSP